MIKGKLLLRLFWHGLSERKSLMSVAAGCRSPVFCCVHLWHEVAVLFSAKGEPRQWRPNCPNEPPYRTRYKRYVDSGACWCASPNSGAGCWPLWSALASTRIRRRLKISSSPFKARIFDDKATHALVVFLLLARAAFVFCSYINQVRAQSVSSES